MEWFDKKAQIVGEILIDNDYRAEFFFKYAIKIPYLKDIDWEVVFKAYERGITKPLGVPYGVLTRSHFKIHSLRAEVQTSGEQQLP